MPDDFVIATNPDADSSLPYLVRLPVGPVGIVLKVRDTWPRTAKTSARTRGSRPCRSGPTCRPPNRPQPRFVRGRSLRA